MDLGAASALHEFASRIADALFIDVVAENDANRVVLDEILGEGKRRRDAAFTLLISVVEMLQSEFFAVAKQFEKMARILTAGHDEDPRDPRINQSLNGVVDHWLVIDRQEVLVCNLCQRLKPGAKAAG